MLNYFEFTFRVVNLAVSPDDDLFLSSASDHTVRLWDTRAPETIAAIYLDSTNSANIAFDPEGLIFAVTSKSKTVFNHYHFFQSAPNASNFLTSVVTMMGLLQHLTCPMFMTPNGIQSVFLLTVNLFWLSRMGIISV